MKTNPPKILLYLLPGLSDILWIAVFLGALALGPQMLNVDGDLGRHLTIGGYILDYGVVPTRDLFSHTMLEQRLTPHEWLAQVIFALGNRASGLDGVVVICGVLIAFTFWLVYRRARLASRSVLPAMLAVILAVAASSLHWLTRPHLFTFLMLALWIEVLENLRAGQLGRWWLLPVLMVAWANLHGAFIAGFVTWGLYGLGCAWDAFWKRNPKGEGLHRHFWRYFWLGGITSLVATLANPSGVKLWGTSVGYLGNRYLVSHTAEYLPPNFQDASTWPFLLMIGLLVVLLGLQSKRIEAYRLLPAAAWLVMGLYSVRNVPLFALVSAPLIASTLSEWLEANQHRVKALSHFFALDQRLLQTDLSLRGVLWPVLIVVFAVWGLRSGIKMDFQQRGNTFDPAVFPVQAVDWLKNHPQPGNVFNYFPWGGYLLYREWPGTNVFIDGQTDFYGEYLTRQYEQVLTHSSGWEDTLKYYQVRWAILPVSEGLASVLSDHPCWETVYQDHTAKVFLKTDHECSDKLSRP